MGKNFARKAICMILALSLVLGTAMIGAFGATKSKTQPAPKPTEKTKTVKKKIAIYKVGQNSKTATLIGVKKKKTKKKTYRFKMWFKTKVKGKKTKVKVTAIGANAFSKCKKMKTFRYGTTRLVKVDKKAFKGLKTKKIKVYITKKMSKKNFNTMKKRFQAAGIPAKNIKKSKSF